MWALAWRPVPIRWRGFARIPAESDLSISRTGHRNRPKVTPSCSEKVRLSGKPFSKLPKAPAEPSTTSSNRKVADSPNLKPRAAACSPSGSFVQYEAIRAGRRPHTKFARMWTSGCQGSSRYSHPRHHSRKQRRQNCGLATISPTLFRWQRGEGHKQVQTAIAHIGPHKLSIRQCRGGHGFIDVGP